MILYSPLLQHQLENANYDDEDPLSKGLRENWDQ